jgi:beta-lactam-binding protein with PASTA domain
VCGGCLPGPIWKQMMENTLAGTPVSSFTGAQQDVKDGSGGTVPSVSGQTVDQAKAALRAAHLDPVVNGSQVYVSYAAAGTVAYTYPASGATVYPGQRVVIYVSAGPPVQQSQPPGPQPNPTDTCGSSNRPGCR